MATNNGNTNVITPPIQPIVSTTGVRNDFYSGLNQLNQVELNGDPFAELFGAMMQNNQTGQDNAIASATAASARAKGQEEQGKQQYIAGVTTAGIKNDTARYLPEYQMGIIEKARQSYTDRYQQLDQAEKLAIAQAKQARNEADVKVLTEKLNYVKQLRKEKADALQKAQEMEWEKYKFNNLSAYQKATESRLRSSSEKSGGYTPSELKKLRAAGIDPTDIKKADNYLYKKGLAPKDITRDYLEENYDRDTLWKLAISKAVGIKRKKNLSKKNEVEELLSNNEYLSYVQDLLSSGYTVDEIIND